MSKILEWLEEEEHRTVGTKLVSARVPLTIAYKIDILTSEFPKTQTEVIQAGLDVGLSLLIDEWRELNAQGKEERAFPIDEEIQILLEQGKFYVGGDDNA